MLARLGQRCCFAFRARPFSSTAKSLQEDRVFSSLYEVVSEQAERQPVVAPSPHIRVEWDRFAANSVLTPKHLTYKNRTRKQNRLGTGAATVPTSREARYTDAFWNLDLDPRDFSTNASMLYPFVTEMGKIKSRNLTRLTQHNQRLLGKAIRRSKHMGVMVNLSKPLRYTRSF